MTPSSSTPNFQSKPGQADAEYLSRLDSEIYSFQTSSEGFDECSDLELLVGYLFRLLELQPKQLRVDSSSISSVLCKNNIYFRHVSVPPLPARGDYPLLVLTCESTGQSYLLLQGTPHNCLLTFNNGRKVLITNPSQFPAFKPSAIEIPFTLADRQVSSSGLLAFAYKRNIGTFAFIFFASLLVMSCGLAIPLLTSFLVSNVLPNGDYWLLLQSLFAMLLILALSVFASYVQGLFSLRMLTIGTRTIEVSVMERFLKVPQLAIQDFSVGELYVAVDAITKLRQLLSSKTLTALLTAVFSVNFLILMFFYNPLLACVVVAFSLPVLVAVLLLARRTIFLYDQVYDVKSDLNQLSSQISTEALAIRGLGAELSLFKDWNEGFRRIADLFRRVNYSEQVIKLILNYYDTVGTILLLMVATLQVLANPALLNEPALIGSFLAFYASFLAFSRAIVDATANIVAPFGVVAALWRRALRILGAPVEQGWSSGLPQQCLEGALKFDAVTFHPPDLRKPILERIDLDVQIGQKIAVLGAKSSGKSSLLRLINGLVSPSEGSIYLDALPLQSTSIQSIRSQIHYVPSSPSLVGLRIADVLGPVALDSEKQLKDIFLTLGISDVFSSLPQGLNTFIAAGSSFSVADKVKLLLSRSLLNPPPILLLDEFLSAIPLQDHAHLLALVAALPSTIVMIPTTKAEVECCSQQWQICEGTLTPLSQTTFADFLATYSL